MNLKIENIGIINKADIKVDGLTVIAGENNSGKSTIGKVLFSAIKADMISLLKVRTNQAQNFETNRINGFSNQIRLVFKNNINRIENDKKLDGHIEIKLEDEVYYNIKTAYDQKLKNDVCIEFNGIDEKKYRKFKDAVIIQTPLVFDLFDTFNSISTLHSETEMLGISTKISYPYFLWDLYTKLKPQNSLPDEIELLNLLNTITSSDLLNGYIKSNQFGELIFQMKNSNLTIPMIDVSIGMKSFAILQLLIQNNMIMKDRLLIIDEPEVHLHPKWQLEYAKIIVEFVRNGISVIVTSHSPYIVEMLEVLSQKHSIESNFYIPQKIGGIVWFEELEVGELRSIYQLLSEPYEEIEEVHRSWREAVEDGD